MSLKRSILKLVSPSQHCFTPITPIYTRTSLSLSSNHIRPFSTSRPSFAKKAFTRGSSKPSPQDDLVNQEKFDATRLEKDMATGVGRLRVEIKTVVNRVGALTPAYLDGLRVELEGGVKSAIDGLAQVIVLDPTTLSVVPYDASHTKLIEKALYESSLNLTPNTRADGSITLAIPRLTVETRQVLAKKAGQVCEQARGVIRNARQAAQKASRKDLDQNLITKDDFKSNNKVLDEITKTHTKAVDEIENKAKRVLLDQ